MSSSPSIHGFSLLLLIIFLLETQCSASIQAQLDIQAAIQASIMDGLATVDHAMRSNYWYYIRGASLLTYKASIKTDRLNYILLYTLPNSVFRVNCDLNFLKWEATVNSFVQVFVSQEQLDRIKNDVSLLDTSHNFLDLTKATVKNNKNSYNSSSNTTKITHDVTSSPQNPTFPPTGAIILSTSNLSANS